MATMVLDGNRPDFELQKSLNTFFQAPSPPDLSETPGNAR
jgi:hypothetical protein